MGLYALRNGEGPAWALEHPPSRPGHGRGCFTRTAPGSSRSGRISPGAGAAGLLGLQISVRVQPLCARGAAAILNLVLVYVMLLHSVPTPRCPRGGSSLGALV